MGWISYVARLKVKILRRAAREDGNATIEAVLWIPFFILAFTFVADTTMILHNQSTIQRVVQDANRALSIGKFQSADKEGEAEDYIESAIAYLTANAVASTAIVDGIITTTVTAPAADLDMMGMFASITSININVRAQHLLEE